jgi:uncharacterized membrane protein YgaE (UPF0421/DUF939 family)
MNSKALVRSLQLPVRAAVGAGVSLGLAQVLGLEFPIYAFLAAVIVTDLSPAQTRQLGWRRVVATVVGAASGALLAGVLSPGPLAVALGVFVAMLLCDRVRMREAAKVGGYICGIVLLSYGAHPWAYAGYRLIETMLGVGVAWGISLVPKLLDVEEAP